LRGYPKDQSTNCASKDGKIRSIDPLTGIAACAGPRLIALGMVKMADILGKCKGSLDRGLSPSVMEGEASALVPNALV
jgi:hypothetical protein